MCQRLNEKTPPVLVTVGDTIMCASGMLAPVDRRETPQTQGAKARIQGAMVRTQGAKVRANISATWYGKQQQHAIAQPPPTRYDQHTTMQQSIHLT